jgi:hypothetical protein
MICTRLQEEMEVCNLLDKSDNSAQGTQSEKKRAAGAVVCILRYGTLA